MKLPNALQAAHEFAYARTNREQGVHASVVAHSKVKPATWATVRLIDDVLGTDIEVEFAQLPTRPDSDVQVTVDKVNRAGKAFDRRYRELKSVLRRESSLWSAGESSEEFAGDDAETASRVAKHLLAIAVRAEQEADSAAPPHIHDVHVWVDDDGTQH